MPKVPWPEFVASHSNGCLVVAVAPKAQRRPLRHRLLMLVTLLGRLKLANAYAATIDRQSGDQKIHIAFEDEKDARRFAEVVRAQPAASHDRAWVRQWVFHMNDATSDAIGAALFTGGEIDER
jgi:hypothetical protein